MLQAAGCNLMFMPDVAEVYPHGYENATRVGLAAWPWRGLGSPARAVDRGRRGAADVYVGPAAAAALHRRRPQRLDDDPAVLL